VRYFSRGSCLAQRSGSTQKLGTTKKKVKVVERLITHLPELLTQKRQRRRIKNRMETRSSQGKTKRMKLLTNEFYHEIGSRASGVHVDERGPVNCKRQITR